MKETTGNVWVVDDDTSIRWVLEKALSREGYRVRQFSSGKSLISALESGSGEYPDVLLSDIRMDGMNGLEIMAAMKSGTRVPVIIMTAFGDLDSAVESYRHGAFEYLTKPFDIQKVLSLVGKACNQSTVVGHAPSRAKRHRIMLGEGPAMQEVFRIIGKLSVSDMNVLIRGESGTGKELVADAIHRNSPRSDSPMIAINTAAIPEELLESELFGHEKGAFTGAHSRHIGRFEQADGGTLFLDEVGDMQAGLQTRLLRVLSEGRFYRVGGREEVHVDVRVVAATNRDLEHLVEAGMFREDLFHRLNVISIHAPALRERREDIPMLVTHFLERTATEFGLEGKQCSSEVIEVMKRYSWPGNVRELENVIGRISVLSPGKVIDQKDLPPELVGRSPREDEWVTRLEEAVTDRLRKGENRFIRSMNAQFEGAVIQVVLDHCKGHRQNAADLLGLSRNTLTRKIQELNLEKSGD